MREGFDREIDSMLRRTARARAGARGLGAARPVSHLDADELAAFAEGALPLAARSNAVSHLADCAECREVAVNLTRAAGVEAKLEKSAAAAAPASSSAARESKPSRGWLAALLAPRALRYVAPALALCLVAAVSFVALRSKRAGGLLPKPESSNAEMRAPITITQSGPQPSPDERASYGAPANANSAPAAQGENEAARAKAPADAPATRVQDKDLKAEAPDGSDAAPVSQPAAADEAQPLPPPPSKEGEKKEGEDSAAAPAELAKSTVENLPATKSGENTKTGPPPAAANDELAANEQSQRQQRAAQPRNLEPQSPDGGLRSNQSRSAANNAAGGGALAGSARDDRESRRGGAVASRRGRSAEDSQSEAERSNAVEESRSAAGHRFRREGGAWVDVNYKPSMASTGVRRGTDGYRALVADIPEIGRVAEQLGGEVVVVVKGRAYRIR
jgi:hypothetical protein